MRRLLCNQVSLSFVGLVLLSLPSKYYHGGDCQESGHRSFLKPFLRKIGKSDLFGSQKFSEGLLKPWTGNTEDSFERNDQEDDGLHFDETLQETGKFLNALTGKVVDSLSGKKEKRASSNDPASPAEEPSSDELFTDFETEVPEKHYEAFENSGSLSSSISGSDKVESRGTELFSILKNIKLIFSIPIKIVKNKKKIQPPEKYYDQPSFT